MNEKKALLVNLMSWLVLVMLLSFDNTNKIGWFGFGWASATIFLTIGRVLNISVE